MDHWIIGGGGSLGVFKVCSAGVEKKIVFITHDVNKYIHKGNTSCMVLEMKEYSLLRKEIIAPRVS